MDYRNIYYLLLLALTFLGTPVWAAETVSLRGDGTVTADFFQNRANFVCESAEKADILRGKLRADLFWDARLVAGQKSVGTAPKSTTPSMWEQPNEFAGLQAEVVMPMNAIRVGVVETPVAVSGKPERVALWGGRAPTGAGQFQRAEAWITIHRPAKPNGAAMVICPGGGYGGLVTGPEGHGIAAWLMGHGITGVVLEYRLPEGLPFVPLLDAQRALRTVRAHAADWGIDPKRVGIMGFSAGGHLASTAGTHFDDGDAAATDPVARQGCRPDVMVLVYPVITMGQN
ncbi:MAG: alpha/beta hydrolase, partial [Phycisphaerae bacterium]